MEEKIKISRAAQAFKASAHYEFFYKKINSDYRAIKERLEDEKNWDDYLRDLGSLNYIKSIFNWLETKAQEERLNTAAEKALIQDDDY